MGADGHRNRLTDWSIEPFFSIIQGFHPVWSKEEPFVFDLANPDVALIRFAVQVKPK